MSIEITAEVTKTFNDSIYVSGHSPLELYALAAALTAVLDMPEVRDAIYADVRREVEAKLKAAGVTGYSVEGI